MEQIQADGNGGIQIQRSAGKLYMFMHVNALSTVCARANNTTGLVTSYQLLPHTTYLMCTEEEYKALKAPGGANPAPASTEASDAGVRTSGPPVAQVGGAHYQQQPGRVQHWDYAAGLLYCEGQVSRYLDRHGKPGGYGAKDVLKSLSYLLKILEVQYHDRWSEHEDMLKDLQSRLADAYKTECAVPKRETVGSPKQCTNGNCTKDAALGGPYCVDCTVDFS